MKNTVSAIKKKINVLNSQIYMTEERICELEDKSIEIIQNEEHREKNQETKMIKALGPC